MRGVRLKRRVSSERMKMDKDTTPLSFGKYKGKTPEEVAEIDGSYVVWMFKNVKPPPCSKELAEACESDDRDDEEEWAACAHYGIGGWGNF